MRSAPAYRAPAPPRRRSPLIWAWFLIPMLTCGLGSFIPVLLGGWLLRSRRHMAAGFGYFLLALVALTGAALDRPHGNPAPADVALAALFILWFGGLGHTIWLQVRLLRSAPADAAPVALRTLMDPALAAAQWRAQRRGESRAILAENPALGVELRIGRPDLPRQYNDGGLIDVNHVPAPLLWAELDLPPEVAAAIVAQRERLGGFSSPEELVVYCDGMTTQRMEIVRDRLVFVAV